MLEAVPLGTSTNLNKHLRHLSECDAEGCNRIPVYRGLCTMHYQRLRKRGEVGPAEPLRIDGPLELRLARYIERMPSGCWEWTSTRQEGGYGTVSPGDGRNNIKAHRAMYEALVGPIPDGLDLDHLCRNPPCVNPSHLEPVTRAENTRRAWEARRNESA